jgi:UDP-N-acetylglucosamine--N-acetylmuramyl-(pentapeptide) pyrophosphoryl-undecaprenol N-acetylglucosamine transferase
MAKVLIMAAGTGGHVFPGLALARELMARGHEPMWLGTPQGMEQRWVPKAGIPLAAIDFKGLRSNGLKRWLLAPFAMFKAMTQALGIMRAQRPALVIGMGGFVSGPGGLAARLLGIPLIIHEQNAVPGLANRLLAGFAVQVIQAFPGSFADNPKVQTLGNPLRPEILALDGQKAPRPLDPRSVDRDALRILVIGGSLGAQALNEQVPAAVHTSGLEFEIRHQSGRGKEEATRANYLKSGVKAQVSEFIEDMAEAYAWADLVICRAGALTLAEITLVGLPAILVPYPYAVDDHQTRNAAVMADHGAGILLPQSELSPERLASCLRQLAETPERLAEMALKARALARADSAQVIVNLCEQVMNP